MKFAVWLLGLVTALATVPTDTVIAQEQSIKVAVFKVPSNGQFLHYQRLAPKGYKFEAVLVNTPGDAKDAVISGAAHFALTGIAAAILSNANGEPAVIVSNLVGGSMSVIAKADSPIKSVADLKGMRVGIQPGSTQELVIMERFKQEGFTIRDVKQIRIGLGEMHAALSRGDVDAYVGTEPNSTLSVVDKVGRLLEHPYGTPTGDLLTAVMGNAKFIAANPKATQDFVLTHARATEFLNSNHDVWTEDASKTFGVKPELFKLAIKNFHADWKMDAGFVKRVKAFAAQMLENKLIRAPVTDKLVDTTFTDTLVKTGL